MSPLKRTLYKTQLSLQMGTRSQLILQLAQKEMDESLPSSNLVARDNPTSNTGYHDETVGVQQTTKTHLHRSVSPSSFSSSTLVARNNPSILDDDPRR